MSRGKYEDLQSATTVGQKLATEWPGDYENYLKVLPRTNTSIPKRMDGLAKGEQKSFQRNL
jgi:hypothetical protein